MMGSQKARRLTQSWPILCANSFVVFERSTEYSYGIIFVERKYEVGV